MEGTGAGASGGDAARSASGSAGTTAASTAPTAPVPPLILGIDAGFVTPGAAAIRLTRPRLTVVDCGAVTTRPQQVNKREIREADQHCERIADGFRFLRTIAQIYTPDLVIVEMPGGGGISANAVRGMAFGMATAVCLVETLQCPVVYVAPEVVKRRLSGGAPGKDPVHKAVREQVDFVGRDPASLPTADLRAAVYDAVAVVLASMDAPMVRMLERRIEKV